MNDAFRGMVMVGATTALYLSTYLAISYLTTRWLGPKEMRPPVRSHAFWMAFTLLCTASVAIITAVSDAGANVPLTWKDVVRGVYSLSSIAGLAPVWAARRKANEGRAERKSKRATSPETTPAVEVAP